MGSESRNQIYLLNSLEETQSLADLLAPQLSSRHILGLYGPMGVGKTHFIQALVRALGGPTDQATSPTFAIHQEYFGTSKTIHHLDLYRLESEEEVESSGFWDLFYEDNVVIAIEWMDRVPENRMPPQFTYWRMEWSVLPEGQRQVKIIPSHPG